MHMNNGGLKPRAVDDPDKYGHIINLEQQTNSANPIPAGEIMGIRAGIMSRITESFVRSVQQEDDDALSSSYLSVYG